MSTPGASHTMSLPKPNKAKPSPAFPEAALVAQGEYAHFSPVLIGRLLTIVGSGPQAHLRLRSRSISRRHAVLLNVDGRVSVCDLASRAHVYLNDKRIRRAILKDGDHLRIGVITFKFVQGPRAEVCASPAAPPAHLRRSDGRTVTLRGPIFLLGRRQDCDLALRGTAVGRAHAIIAEAFGRHFMIHLSAHRVTLVNGSKLDEKILREGYDIEIGGHHLFYETAQELPTPLRWQADAEKPELETSPPEPVSRGADIVPAPDVASADSDSGDANPAQSLDLSPPPLSCPEGASDQQDVLNADLGLPSQSPPLPTEPTPEPVAPDSEPGQLAHAAESAPIAAPARGDEMYGSDAPEAGGSTQPPPGESAGFEVQERSPSTNDLRPVEPANVGSADQPPPGAPELNWSLLDHDDDSEGSDGPASVNDSGTSIFGDVLAPVGEPGPPPNWVRSCGPLALAMVAVEQPQVLASPRAVPGGRGGRSIVIGAFVLAGIVAMGTWYAFEVYGR